MIGEAPNYSWDKYARQVGEIKHYDKKAKERGDSGYSLIALSTETPDEIKMDFERFQNKYFNGLAKFYVPNMQDPYYTWEGKVVERSSLAGRELPLAD